VELNGEKKLSIHVACVFSVQAAFSACLSIPVYLTTYL